jgi:predicted O-methyltransferase YrrM
MHPDRTRLRRWAPAILTIAAVATAAIVVLAAMGRISLGEALILLAIGAVGVVVCYAAVTERRFRINLPVRISDIVTKRGIADYEQFVAWTELQRHLAPADFMPPLRAWAASPDVLRIVAQAIDSARPDLVVECGSGASTVWIGYALRRAGRGRLVALEHDERYADLSRALVSAYELDDVVEVRYAPLTEQRAGRGSTQPWYDPAAIDDLAGIGVLFIDGPPDHVGPMARYPAIPLLLDRCTPDATIVLDDAARPEERATVDRWLAERPELRRRSVPAEKGADVFTLR